MTDVSQKKNIYYYLSLIVSYIFHPVLISTYIFIAFWQFGNFVFQPFPNSVQFKIVLLIFTTTAIVPLLLFFLNTLILKGKISKDDLFMTQSKDRFVPFLYTGVFYSTLTYLLYTYLRFPVLLIFYLGIISTCILLTAIISLFWKISAHALAIGAALMIFCLTYTILPDDRMFYVIISTLFISGIILSSRLYLNAHEPSQVYTGFLLGMFIGACGLYFLVPNVLTISF